MTVDSLFRNSAASATHEVLLVVVGGLLAALPGIAWLISTGAWPHFLEMMLEWNPEYLAAGRSRQSLHRWILLLERFYPWWTVHVAALLVAGRTLWKTITHCRQFPTVNTRDDSIEKRTQAGLAACYLSWVVQSLLLQHAMDYIQVPGLLLGMLVLAQHPWLLPIELRRIAVASLLILAISSTPTFSASRLAMWMTCWQQGSTATVRATLAHGNFPRWDDIEQVADFLRHQQVRDGDVTCINVHSVHLYGELNIAPPTRYWCVRILQELFPSRAAMIDESVRQSTSRFIVTEEQETQLTAGPNYQQQFPWQLPVVFRSGSYQVRCTGKYCRPNQHRIANDTKDRRGNNWRG